MAVSEKKEVYGGFASVNLRKPNLMQNDPRKGDYVHGKDEFAESLILSGSSPAAGGAFRVTLTPAEYDESKGCSVCTADKTVEEITAALENGSCVTAVYPLALGDDMTSPIDIPYVTYVDDGDDPIIVFSKSVTLATDTLFVSVLYMPLIGAAMVFVTENTGAANLARAEEVSF